MLVESVTERPLIARAVASFAIMNRVESKTFADARVCSARCEIQ